MDCIQVSVLPGCDLHYSFAKCYHWEKLGSVHKGLSVLLLTPACESIIIAIKISGKMLERGFLRGRSV